jgi:betaine-aldehyde dehydrogenase
MKVHGNILVPQGNIIDGAWVPAISGETLPVHDPATGEHIATIAASGAADIDIAVAAARRSFESGVWSRMSPSDRGRILWRLASLIRDQAEELAITETRDTGKPIREAREDMNGAADVFEYYAGAATKIVGETQPLPGGQMGFVLQEPAGVVGIITPWNFPLYIAAWKTGPALAVGCSVVLKPPVLSSLTCLQLGDLALRAGIPAGVLNIVSGRGEDAGAALASHPDVDVLAFTGGTDTGGTVLSARARLVRPTQTELGGKSPDVVFDDADLDRAVAGVAFGIFYAQGENCNAGSRLLLQSSIYDRFLERLVEYVSRIRVLPPLDEDSQLGALVSQAQLDKVERYVRIGAEEGARVVCGGKRLLDGEFAKGLFYPPTILADVTPDARAFREEIFGPVLTVTPFDDEDEAIRLANATEFGLAAGVWTSNVDRAMRCVLWIKSGYVWVNTFNGTPVEMPFGGVKSSGFGRDASMHAIDTFTSLKSVVWAVAPYQDWYGG